MSLRTKANKSWAKKARGEFRDKSWKDTQQGYWGTDTSISNAGISYTNTVPWFRLQKRKYVIHNDLVAYLNKFFGNLF